MISLFFGSFFFTLFRKPSLLSALGVFNMLSMDIYSLGMNLALVCSQNGNSIPGNTVDLLSFPMITFMGHSFLDSSHCLNVYNVTFLVNVYVCGQRNNSMFPERPGEHVTGASLSHHLGELLEDGGSS